MKEKGKADSKFSAAIIMNPGALLNKVSVKMHWHVECLDKDGNRKWLEEFENLIVNVGLDDILEQYFNGSGYTAAHFVGLKGTGAPAVGDTMGSHASWGTVTPYSDATDPAYSPAAVSGQSLDNGASKAVFNINATLTIYGAFLKTDNTKGGTAGTLYSAGDFGASRGVADGDTVNVTVTCTMASA